MKKIYRWKFLRKGMKSNSGNLKWKMGVWNTTNGELNICNNGLHCSKEPYEAFSYVQGEILAYVECRGKSIMENDKECWEEQRVIKAYKWTKRESVMLSIFSAKMCLDNFEKLYPEDKRPLEAIEAAERWFKNPTKKNRSAAMSAARSARSAARSAESAESAESAAWSAARSAESAARSARSAESAARSAESARSAAWSARSAAVNKIKKYFKKIVNNLEEIQ